MCGIAGVYNYATDQPVDLTLLLHMSELVAHRGPDDHGFFHDRKIGLAHRRLSVIDLSQAGHQPMSNEDKTAWIVYNGECYNYLDFHKLLHTRRHKIRSNTDAEVILHLYEEYDVDLLGKIDGMFAFAIWDLEKQRLFIARDRIGIKPLFYYQDPQRLLFASELKSLLADPDISREIDYGALGNFFRLMSIPDPNSIFKYIKKLQPGHYLLVEKGKVQVKSYWDISHFRPAAVNNFETACKQFNRHFEETVKSHMIADVPLGAFLSGGVDSSALVAMTSQDRKTPVHTISASFKGLREFDESGFASQVAQKFGTDHQEFQLEPDLMSALPKMVWHADEPFAISSA
ncbi:MAG: asparagine synthase (glutamine-hydrolyzing), partial [Desulfobacteraceae bacterium]